MSESQPNVERLEQKIAALDSQIGRLTDGFAEGVLPASVVKPKIDQALAEKQNAETEIRRYAHPTPKLPAIPTFQETLLQSLDDPEMQKAAVGGLIQGIIVQPTAALEIQCSFQTFFQTIALRGIEPRFDG